MPAQWQWQAGVQRALPWSMAIDVSYVGNHGFNRMGALQGGSTVNLNAIDIGTAYLPQYQDTTRAANPSVPGATALCPANLLRPFTGAREHQREPDRVLGHLSLAPDVAEPPVPQRVLVRCELHLRDLVQGQPRPAAAVHAQRATARSALRDDQDEFEKLNETLDRRPHSLKANAVWDLPEREPPGNGRRRDPQRLAPRRRPDGRIG